LQQRIRQQPYLGIFDGADTNAVTGKRAVSTTPGQALFLMNSPFVHERSGEFAARIARESETTPERIRRAYRLALGRAARDDEVARATSFLDRCAAEVEANGVSAAESARVAWASLLRVLVGSNEFTFLD
jgi:hypothetical protein